MEFVDLLEREANPSITRLAGRNRATRSCVSYPICVEKKDLLIQLNDLQKIEIMRTWADINRKISREFHQQTRS